MTGARLQVVSDGVLSFVSRDDPTGPREVTGERCDRAYAAGGTVSCLRPMSALNAGELVVFDSTLQRRLRTVPLQGIPNRTRVSESGRMVSWTEFVEGHSYTSGSFSTNTGILDLKTGDVLWSLEYFTSMKDGVPVVAPDTNFWGVTFAADDNRFYVSMSTGGKRFLMRGDFRAMRMEVIAENVECPSLSPDGTRIAFKAAVNGDPAQGWRLSTMDLASGVVVPLAETRSVDDQPAWLDDDTVAYAIRRDEAASDVWAVPADGSGTPRLLVPAASSPATLEPPADRPHR
nr:PD40 domain-containing protein [Saccharothrix mutabilis subsp. capreolus]